MATMAATLPIMIEEGRVADAPAISLIGATTFTETFGFSVPANDLADFLATTYTAQAVSEQMANPNIATIVARDAEGTVLGFVQLHRYATESCIEGDPTSHAELQRLYVDAAAHGRGIGSKLVAAVEEKAKEEGFEKLWLNVWEDNIKAQRLYERLGYTKVGALDFATGSCVQTDWVMVKRL